MEDDFRKDDEVGSGIIKLNDLITKELTGVSGKWFTLNYGRTNEKAAEI
jgi:hypothetical protein